MQVPGEFEIEAFLRNEDQSIDTVRASRDGHAFHEAWAVRTSLELLPPDSKLTAISMESFSPLDLGAISEESIQVADLTKYFGSNNFSDSERVEVVQFKYSISYQNQAISFSGVEATLKKFASTEADYSKTHGTAATAKKLHYIFFTNRPISSALNEALRCLATGDAPSKPNENIEKLRSCTEDYKIDPIDFFRRVQFFGSRGSLNDVDRNIQLRLADWTETTDVLARLGLHEIRRLVHDKAGSRGQRNPMVDRYDILGALGISNPEILYPAPTAFPNVKNLLHRKAVDDVCALVDQGISVLVNGPGGCGKTVLMQGIAAKLTEHFVVTFDGFGAGRWRDPTDGRHSASQTFLQLANSLAAYGLCDLLLPTADEFQLRETFRARLQQAAATAAASRIDAKIVLILDAIDHAGLRAEQTRTNSFAHLLLESLSLFPIPGVVVVGSCRTKRIEKAIGGAQLFKFSVPKFSDTELHAIIASGAMDATFAEQVALIERSGGNPRCLATLIELGRPFDTLGPQQHLQTDSDSLLDELLLERIEKFRQQAMNRGSDRTQIDTFLASVALLPPPVPANEIAAATNIDVADIEGFVADLVPMIEHTAHGIIFRDEPTEDVIRRKLAPESASLVALMKSLSRRQTESFYAARAFPGVLIELNEAERLFALAMDPVVPGNSKVATHGIRLARVLSAVHLNAKRGHTDELFALALEASDVSMAHERSDRFIHTNPDLVAISADPEAMRRLFSSKLEWAGATAAATAVASAFSGDLARADRDADRAVRWFNWSIENSRTRKNEEHVRRDDGLHRDVLNFSYVLAITGQEQKVAGWISQQENSYAYFSSLLLRLSHHSRIEPTIADRRDEIVETLAAVLRSTSVAFCVARLLSDIQDGRRIDRAIADLEAAKRTASTDFWKLIPSAHLAMAAMIARKASRRQLSLWLVKSCRTNLPRIYDLESPLDEFRKISSGILVCAVRSLISGNSPSLLDFIPEELVKLVPKSVSRANEQAWLVALKEKLTRPANQKAVRPAKRKRAGKKSTKTFDAELGQRFDRAFELRIRLLVEYARAGAQILDAANSDEVRIASQAYTELVYDGDTSSNYPYRDQKAFRARLSLQLILDLATWGNLLDAETNNSLIEWIKRSPSLPSRKLIDLISAWSAYPAMHEPALKLASTVSDGMSGDVDASNRINLHGHLSRSVIRVTKSEAAFYYRKGLELSEATGSDSYERLIQLIGVCSEYNGPPLEPQALYSFSQIVEVNLHEPSKFDWNAYTEGLVRLGGRLSLQILNRIDDRDKAPLEYSLHYCLKHLVDCGQLDAGLVAPLCGLTDFSGGWEWGWENIVSSTIERLPQAAREYFVACVIQEIDRTQGQSPRRSTVENLLSIADKHLPSDSPSALRLRRTLDVLDPPTAYEGFLAEKRTQQELVFDKFSDPVAIENLLAKSDDSIPQIDLSTFRISDLISAASTPAQREALMISLPTVRNVSLYDKLAAIEPHIEGWASLSQGLKDQLPTVWLRLAAAHADELTDSQWESRYAWRILLKMPKGEGAKIVAAVLTVVGESRREIPSDVWLMLSSLLISSVDKTKSGSALQRFLLRAGSTIPANEADGVWREDLLSELDSDRSVAALLWARLGNGSANSRWRAAHAIKRLADLHQWKIIQLLVENLDAQEAGAFVDTRLPFYAMQARTWLLISLARVSQDYPDKLAAHLSVFERIAFSPSFPHVLMRAFAAEIITRIAPFTSDETGVRERARSVNVSTITSDGARRQAENRRRGNSKETDSDEFSLDYDFSKSHATELSEVFGVSLGEVERMITGWVRKWDGSARSMYDCPRQRGEYGYRDAWSGSMPAFDRYGDYLGWHALLLSAGELLAVKPIITEGKWRTAPWSDFLGDFLLTYGTDQWLSDHTDLSAIESVRSVPMPPPRSDSSRAKDQVALRPLLHLNSAGTVGSVLPVSGSWQLPDGTSIRASSVLCEENELKILTSSILTAPTSHFFYLPDREDDIERQIRSVGGTSIQSWLSPAVERSTRIDEHDPYASQLAARRELPESWVIERYGLKPEKHGRVWTGPTGLAMSSIAWGGRTGTGRRSSDDSATRVDVSDHFLAHLLRDQNCYLVGLLVAERITPSDRYNDEDGGIARRFMVFIVDQRGKVRIAQRPNSQLKAEITKLSKYDIADFHSRFGAALRAWNSSKEAQLR